MAIEVKVESHARDGLRLIKHVPADRTCRLEGKNGVGKTALIRLLVLMSGVQSFLGEPGSWRSLRNLVGPTVITISGMRGPHATARLQLTPERWPDVPSQMVGDWLGRLELDGKAAPASDLFPHLDVVHLIGTERLSDSLGHQYVRVGTSLRGLKASLKQALEDEDQLADLGQIAEQLKDASPRVAEEERVERASSQSERQQLADQIGALTPKIEDLQQAAGLRALLDTGDAAAQAQQLDALRKERETARAALGASETRHESAVAALNKGETKTQRDAAKIERKLRVLSKEQDQLAARQETLGPRLETMGIPSATEKLEEQDTAKLANALDAAQARQREAQLLAAKVNRSQTENDLIDELRVVLHGAIEKGLAPLRIAALNGEDVTVADLAGALGRLNDPGEIDLDELTEANAAVSELSELQRIFQRREEAGREQDEARAGLDELGSALAEHDVLREEAQRARAERDVASATVRSLNMQIGALTRSGFGGVDVTDGEARVTEILTKHGVAPGALAEALAEVQAALGRMQQRDKELQQAERDLSDKAARRRVLRDKLRHRAQTDPQLAWLVPLAAAFAYSSDVATTQDELSVSDDDWTDSIWQAVSDHVTAVRNALITLRRDVEGLETVAGNKTQSGPYGPGLRMVIEQDALRQLSAGPIAEALFDGGRLERISMDDETVTWTTPQGETRTRPLAAFSSGEQAFGFIRAQLQQQVADVSAENRLIFLDEFGAFIAADRRRPLADLLTSDVLLGPNDQVIVVLPLQADYEAELDQTTGQLHELYQRRASDVAVAGYFTEVFER